MRISRDVERLRSLGHALEAAILYFGGESPELFGNPSIWFAPATGNFAFGEKQGPAVLDLADGLDDLLPIPATQVVERNAVQRVAFEIAKMHYERFSGRIPQLEQECILERLRETPAELGEF